METRPDIAANRLPKEAYPRNFCDKTPPLNWMNARTESLRCYFCYDAPCIEACPTQINIPSFIRKISTENFKGAAKDILSQNIMGGTCARVCPVETLCEHACVRNAGEGKPVTISALQRFATDWLFQNDIQPFTRAKPTGKKVAVVGAGPAGLSCAHRLALLGHDVVIFEAKAKLGGLNEFGLAAYKVEDDFVQKEIEFILKIGGIVIKFNHALGKNISLAQLQETFDAVFLGVGLSGINALQLEGEDNPGVINAVKYIEMIRQTKDLGRLPVGRDVVVIGGGCTAIDIAVQMKLLGAENVTMVYRRGVETMGATWSERELAQHSGVLIKNWARPSKLIRSENGITGIEFERTRLGSAGKLEGTGERYTLMADMVFKAIGQVLVPEDLGDVPKLLEINQGKIVVDQSRKTTLQKVFAGGDCINGGKLTVISVQDGKIAAQAIHQQLAGGL